MEISPEHELDILYSMFLRKYKYYRGDMVQIVEFGDMNGMQMKITTPRYHNIDSEQSYLLEDTPIPFKESELILIKSNPNGRRDTINFFNGWIEKAKQKLDSE